MNIKAEALKAYLDADVDPEESRYGDGSSTAFWVDQFKQLDRALPRYNPERVADFNKVMRHYQSSGLSGRHSGTPAHWYQEYRSGSLSLEQAASELARELPNVSMIR